MPFSPDTLYLSPKDLTEILKASLKWVYLRLNAGDIPGSFRLGGNWYIDRDIFTQTLKQKASKPQTKIRRTDGNQDRHDLL
jgi:hypothetical protein